MAREARVDLEGLLYHVIQRGIERGRIFRETKDYSDFVRRLGQLFRFPAASIYAWALMPNHVHLVLRRGKTPLSRLMHRLWTGYAVTYNLRHDRAGHLRQNRFQAYLCRDENYLFELVRYVHLNPLKGGIVPNLGALEAFPWTGHAPLIRGKLPPFQDGKTVLGWFDSKRPVAVDYYRTFVESGWREIQIKRGLRIEIPDDGSPLAIKGEAPVIVEEPDQPPVPPRPEPSRTAARRPVFEILEEIEELYSIHSSEILSQRRDRPICAARAVFCYLAKREGALSGEDLARLCGVSSSAVSRLTRRGEAIWEERSEGTPELVRKVR